MNRHCPELNGWAELESKLSFFSGGKCLGRDSLSKYNITGTGYSTLRFSCKVVSHSVLHTSIAEIMIHRKYSLRTTRSQLFLLRDDSGIFCLWGAQLQDLSSENLNHVSFLRTIFSFCYVWRESISYSTLYWNWVTVIFAFTKILVALSWYITAVRLADDSSYACPLDISVSVSLFMYKR